MFSGTQLSSNWHWHRKELTPHLLMLPEQLVPLEEILVLQLLLDKLVLLLLLMLFKIPDTRLPV